MKNLFTTAITLLLSMTVLAGCVTAQIGTNDTLIAIPAR